MVSDGRPRDHEKQNRQARDAANSYNLNEYGREKLQRTLENSDEELSWAEVLEEARSIAEESDKYVNKK
jgi:DNA-binding PadR family transcriptional regulator